MTGARQPSDRGPYGCTCGLLLRPLGSERSPHHLSPRELRGSLVEEDDLPRRLEGLQVLAFTCSFLQLRPLAPAGGRCTTRTRRVAARTRSRERRSLEPPRRRGGTPERPPPPAGTCSRRLDSVTMSSSRPSMKRRPASSKCARSPVLIKFPTVSLVRPRRSTRRTPTHRPRTGDRAARPPPLHGQGRAPGPSCRMAAGPCARRPQVGGRGQRRQAGLRRAVDVVQHVAEGVHEPARQIGAERRRRGDDHRRLPVS